MGCLLGYILSPRKTGKGKSVPIMCISLNCGASLHAENLQICWNSMATQPGRITARSDNQLRSCVRERNRLPA